MLLRSGVGLLRMLLRGGTSLRVLLLRSGTSLLRMLLRRRTGLRTFWPGSGGAGIRRLMNLWRTCGSGLSGMRRRTVLRYGVCSGRRRLLVRHLDGRGVVRLCCRCFLRSRSCTDPPRATVEAGPVVAVVGNRLVIRVMDDRCIHVAYRGVIGKVPALPASAVESTSPVAEAIVHSAVEAYRWTPVARIKGIESI